MQTKLLADMVRVMTTQVPPEKETTIFDTVLPRFALRVRPPAKPGKPWPSVYFIRWEGAGRRLVDGRAKPAKTRDESLLISFSPSRMLKNSELALRTASG